MLKSIPYFCLIKYNIEKLSKQFDKIRIKVINILNKCTT